MMKNLNRFLVALILFVATIGLVAVYQSGMFLKTKAARSVSQKAVYYCPMHPTYTSDRPGDCPICNMKLVKKEIPNRGSELGVEQAGAPSKRDICYLHNCPHLKEGGPCPMLVVSKEGEQVTCPICGTHVSEGVRTAKEQKILYWTDPMIPGYKSDKPGKSPMGMDLVPVYEEEMPGSISSASAPPGYAPILVTPEKQQLIGVKTAKAGRRNLVKTIRTVGTVAHDPELYQAQAEYIQAIQTLARAKSGSIPEVVEQAEQLVESTKIRLKHMGLSDELIQEIATWKGPEHSLLFAHAGGQVWVYVPIYEYELPLVRVGQGLTAEVPALPSRAFRGKIRAIDAMVEQITRTIRVRAQLEDPEGLLKPDMFINVTIQIDLGEVLAVPAEAVFQTGEKNIIFVAKANGLFEPREVTLGAQSENSWEVKAGISEGEMVVTSGNFLIDSESRLKGALQNVGGGEHQHGS